jgi:hypothetical protein
MCAEFLLPASLRFSLSGEPSINDIISGMFSLNEVQATGGGIKLKTHQPEFSKIDNCVPPWLIKTIKDESHLNSEVMVYDKTGVAFVLWQRNNLSCCWLDRNDNCLNFLTTNKSDSQSFCSVQTALSPVLRDLYIDRKALLLHAASICCFEETGILLLADGGGGKTTTSLSLMTNGAKLLGDDLAVVQDNGSDFILEGIPEKMNLTKETLSFFPDLSQLHDDFDELYLGYGRDKVPILPQDIIEKSCVRKKSVLRNIFYIHISDKGPSLELLPKSQALGILIRSHTFSPDQKLLPECFALLGDVTSRLNMHVLHTGPDPKSLGGWLIEQLKLTDRSV